MTMKTRASHTIPKPDLNKSLFDNYLTNSQVPTGYSNADFEKREYLSNYLDFDLTAFKIFYDAIIDIR